MKIPIIIDTDPGHDDALALMLAVKSDVFDIKAITTVAGNSTIENTTKNARYILKLLGKENIPIYSGAEAPIKRNLIKAVVHGESGLAGINVEEEARLNGLAVEKIVSLVNSNPGIIIVTLGPLTNIARAIIKSPKIMKKISKIVMMGGAIKVPGNENRVSEFNFFVDPEAADIIFRFPVKKTLIPLDACNNVEMYLEDFQKISDNKIREPILSMIEKFIEGVYKDQGIKAALVYDALTIYYLIRPEICSVAKMDVSIETVGSLTRGMSVADLRHKSEKGLNTEVVMAIPREDFINDFINILNS